MRDALGALSGDGRDPSLAEVGMVDPVAGSELQVAVVAEVFAA